MIPNTVSQKLAHPVTLVVGILVAVTISGFFYLNNESEQISIGVADQQCVVDADCTFVASDCGDCKYEAIAKERLQSFLGTKQKFCEANPPKTMCDMVFVGSAKCVENSCQIIR